MDADLDVAVRAFRGTAADRRVWAAIAWRVGVDEFHYALMDKLSEDAADGAPESPAAAFQAFLNRRFPKDRPLDENSMRNNSCPMGRATMVRRNSAAEGGAA